MLDEPDDIKVGAPPFCLSEIALPANAISGTEMDNAGTRGLGPKAARALDPYGRQHGKVRADRYRLIGWRRGLETIAAG